MRLLTLLACSVLFAAAAQASPRLGFDGCYQLYTEGAMAPVVCLQGTAEEGINGAGVRLTVFGTNTDRVKFCGTSSSSGMTSDSFVFEMNGRVEMTLKDVQVKRGLKQGTAIFGRTTLKFLEVSEQNTNRLMDIANSACEF